MCLILFAYGLHPERPLVLAANRDEFYARQSLAAHWWQHDGGGEAGIYGGRDVQAGGTWLAVSARGRLAAVTNWTEQGSAAQPSRSRGELPRCFLEDGAPARRFAAAIEGRRYAGFNFIAFDGEELAYASNRTGETRVLAPGVYGLTNTRLGVGLGADKAPREGSLAMSCIDDWPKAAIGAAALKAIAADARSDDLIDLLSQSLLPERPPNVQRQGPGPESSPGFISGSDYGTRASTAVVVGRESLEFVEQLYGPFGNPGERSRTRFAFADRQQSKETA